MSSRLPFQPATVIYGDHALQTGRGAEGALVATQQDCESAVQTLVAKLAEVTPELRRKYAVDRTVSCRVADLEVVFVGRLSDAGLTGVHTEVADRAQVRLTVSSDDLLALCDGRLGIGAAVATARLRVQAGPMDLLKLRTLM